MKKNCASSGGDLLGEPMQFDRSVAAQTDPVESLDWHRVPSPQFVLSPNTNAFNKRPKNECKEIDLKPLPLWKHFVDLSFVSFTCLTWIPLMILIALAIKIVSRGPIFFSQERIGYRKKPFTCLKFRSMRVDADTQLHSQYMADLISTNSPMVKMDSRDPRLIRFGALLRASGLDELPQFINVIRREMSLVGPRPCTRSEFERYSDLDKERFGTLPGLTGLWQVSGKNKTTFRQMIDLDISYAKNKTLWMDLEIIVKTVPAVLSQLRDSRGQKSHSSSPVSLARVFKLALARIWSLSPWRRGAGRAHIGTNLQPTSNDVSMARSPKDR